MDLEQAQGLVVRDEEFERALEKVGKLDFRALKEKLATDKGWTMEFCGEVEDLYRKFLALNVRYMGQKVCPTGPIDEFWHAHILDTHAYESDCRALFGGFLHHYPYFGMRGAEDRLDLENAFSWSVSLFILHFGVDPTAGDSNARSCRPQRCP